MSINIGLYENFDGSLNGRYKQREQRRSITDRLGRILERAN